ISFVSVETQDRFHNPLQQVSSYEQILMNQYDPGNSIPFIDIGGQYLIQPSPNSPGVYAGSQYIPSIINGLNWTQIGSRLNDPSSAVAQAIDGAANTIIKAVCQVDGGRPSGICSLTLAQPTMAPPSGGSHRSSGLNIFIGTRTNFDDQYWRKSLRHI
ncbi:hypothetical protein J2P12_06075, partial [Candidatus Bathyarchaeota archaeon]|nr:hypothetical protein [Candidatus Bathyarchaeota archaeon]